MGAVILPNASTTKANGNKYMIDSLYTRLQLLQSAQGAMPGAFDAWLALRGAQTLSLRMKEHGQSAIKLTLGDVQSLPELPEKMTHGSIRPAERLALGITPDLIRLNLGVKDIDVLIADVDQALPWAVNGWNFASTRLDKWQQVGRGPALRSG
ncbi:hypothetical protein M422DRAFT_275606 [Sphaerobolus stellatus SS14]|uniref:Uncharacterized protein n=1 Tax=Sphaerobolus stellatus (strain SS14) TaxID=990650 RepID=A0A0C9UE39_SPHS4|nr:hypothetical protein M422DRAFT_275606 [Sphaerobolus stellatus SS14]